MTSWQDIQPADAVDIDCTTRPDLNPPRNEMGEVCPWPWGPQQLAGAPLGQYHCEFCGAMVCAGVPHPDYTGLDEQLQAYFEEEERREAAGDMPAPDDDDPFGDQPWAKS